MVFLAILDNYDLKDQTTNEGDQVIRTFVHSLQC